MLVVIFHYNGDGAKSFNTVFTFLYDNAGVFSFFCTKDESVAAACCYEVSKTKHASESTQIGLFVFKRVQQIQKK